MSNIRAFPNYLLIALALILGLAFPMACEAQYFPPGGGGTGGGDIVTVSGVITSAQLKALHGTPIQIVAAQGAGKVIVPVSVSCKLAFGTTAYVAGGGGALYLMWGASQVVTGSPIVSNVNMTQIQSIWFPAWTQTSANALTTNIENVNLNFTNLSATEFTTGDGTFVYNVDYRVVQF